MAYVKIWLPSAWGTRYRDLLESTIHQLVCSHIMENAINKGIFIDCIGGHHDHLLSPITLNADMSVSKQMQLIKAKVLLMSKIHFKFSLNSLHRRNEISEFYFRKFFADLFLQLSYSHTFAGIGHTDLSEIPIGANIKIPPLDHIQARCFDQLSQGFIL